jgi:polyisoprenoid-binding protein YceI
MRIGYTGALCLAITVSGFGQTPSASRAHEFYIDAAHSTIEFDIPFMYSRVRGRFDDVRGTILWPDSSMGKIADAGAMAVIRVASVNTGSAHRDEHLRSSDFFDADRFPLIVFRATRVIGTMYEFTLVGSLSMHGVTREIRIPAKLVLAPVRDPHNLVLADVTGSTTIARKDFGIIGGDAHNEWFDRLRSATMGDSAHVSLDLHLWMPDAAAPGRNTIATIATIDSVGIDSAVTLLRSLHARDTAKFASAQAFLDEVGATLLERDRVREGFLWLHAVARLLPSSADAMVSVGTANALMGDSTRAMIWYRQAIIADSLNTRAYVRIGTRFGTVGRSPK